MRKWIVIAAFLLGLASFAQEKEQGDITLNVVMTGADSVPSDVRNAIASKIRRTVTEPGQIPDEMMERIRDQFQQHGYFKVVVEAPQTTETRNSNGYVTSMEVRVHIDEGRQYRLGHISFTGAKEFDSTRLRAAVPLKDGDIFKIEQLRIALKNMRDLYCSRGYINFTPVPNTDIDEEHLRVNVTFDLDEGEKYRFGKLILNGVEPYPGARQKIMDTWEPHEGQIFDCDLWHKEFELMKRGNLQGAIDAILASDIRRGGPPEVTVNNNTKTVDLHFEFPDPKEILSHSTSSPR